MGIHRTHRAATKPPCFCWQMEMEMGMCVVCQCQVPVVCSIIIYYLYLYRIQDTGTGIHVRRTRGTEHGELEFEIFNSALRWALPFVLFKFLAVPVLLLQGPMPCAVMCGICSCCLLCCCCCWLMPPMSLLLLTPPGNTDNSE